MYHTPLSQLKEQNHRGGGGGELTPFLLSRNLLDKKKSQPAYAFGFKGSASFSENCDFHNLTH